MKERNFWEGTFRKFRTETAAEKYKEAEARANRLIGAFKLKQWKNFLKNQGKSPFSTIPFRKRINRLRAGKIKTSIADLNHNNGIVTDPAEKAEIFGLRTRKNFFGLDENPRFDSAQKQKVEENMADWKNKFISNQKRFRKFSGDELNAAIRHMNGKTSIDPLGISNKMLKKLGPIAKDKLLNLFNECLKEERVPQTWKHSVITMILKNGQDNGNAGKYRPISMTPCLARLFERLVLQRLEVFLKTNNIKINNQSGFRKNRQTKDNIFFITQKSQQAFNEYKKTLAVFFDIAGAFDKVWHSGLIYKLAIMKVPYYLLKIIMNFLEDRSFSVKLEGTLSSRRLIKCGVPHGGVFSPTLFSCYINDVPLAEGANEKCLLFADDIVFTLSFFYKKKIESPKRPPMRLKINAKFT